MTHSANPLPPAVVTIASGLRLDTTTDADGPVFARFFAGYDKAFVLANEKEDRDGFERCFALNHGAAYAELSTRVGPYCEICLVATNSEGQEIGGANFIAAPSADGRTITANLNYLYVEPSARRKGNLARMVEGVREAVARTFPAIAQPRVLLFIEQNDPFRMSEADYRRDSDFTGLDQIDRLRLWAKLGALVVDFPYQQPPLSDAQMADDTLAYSVLGADAASLDACVLEGHLRVFFGVSVLKGADLTSSLVARQQIDTLQRACVTGGTIALLDPAPLLARMPSRAAAFGLWPEPPSTLRAALARKLP